MTIARKRAWIDQLQEWKTRSVLLSPDELYLTSRLDEWATLCPYRGFNGKPPSRSSSLFELYRGGWKYFQGRHWMERQLSTLMTPHWVRITAVLDAIQIEIRCGDYWVADAGRNPHYVRCSWLLGQYLSHVRVKYLCRDATPGAERY